MRHTTPVLDKNLTVYAFKLAALHPAAKPHLLKELAKHENTWVRTAVAGNPNTPKGILADFCKVKTNYPIIRTAAASNDSTPIRALKARLKDKNVYVRRAAELNLKRRNAL